METRPAKPVGEVGIDHVAIEVGDVDEALAFYGRIFHVLRDMGLQLEKSRAELGELAAKGMAPGSAEHAGE